jgi:hypothetical protein
MKMSTSLDIALVLLTVALALGYLLWRRSRASRKLARDWTSGRAENCGACPVIEIRKAQRKNTENAR